jgi:hypothetical protein
MIRAMDVVTSGAGLPPGVTVESLTKEAIRGRVIDGTGDPRVVPVVMGTPPVPAPAAVIAISPQAAALAWAVTPPHAEPHTASASPAATTGAPAPSSAGPGLDRSA